LFLYARRFSQLILEEVWATCLPAGRGKQRSRKDKDEEKYMKIIKR